MIQGYQAHIFYACIKKYEFGIRNNMRKKPDRADFEYWKNCGSRRWSNFCIMKNECETHIIHA